MLLRFRFTFALYLPMIVGILVTPPSAQSQAATDGTNTHPASATVDVSSGSGSSGSLNGQIVAVAGGGSTAPSTAPVPAQQAQIASPEHLATDSAGNVYFLDQDGAVVEKYDPTAGTVTTVAGCLQNGIVCGTQASATSTPATDIVFCSLGELGSAPAGVCAQDLTIDAADGFLFIADAQNGTVDLVTLSTGMLTAVAGCLNGCTLPTATPEPADSARFGALFGVAYDAAAQVLFISDAQFGLVDVWYPSNGQFQVKAFAGGGQNALSSSPQGITSVEIDSPASLAVDGAGDVLYVASDVPGTTFPSAQLASVVSKIEVQTGTIQLWASGEASNTVAAIAADANDNLYIASTNDTTPNLNLVLRVDTSGNATTIAGGGNSNTSYSLQPATGTNVKPVGLATDQSGNLYISDYANNYLAEMPASNSGSGAPDFSVTVAPAAQSVATGASATLTVATEAVNGDSASIDFTCTAPASGCSFSPATVSPGGSSTLTVAASALAVGSDTITVSASDGTNTHTASATVTVTAAVPNFTMTLTPASSTITAGANATIAVATTAVNGDAASLSFQCMQPASGCSFSPASVTPGSSSTLTVSASALTAGSNTISVSATDGTNTQTANTTITVTAGPDFTMTLTPANSTIAAGANATIAVATTAVNGDAASLSFQCMQPASGCSFSPASVTPGSSSTLTVSASALTAGSNTISVSATDGTNTQTANTTITVTAAPDFSLSALPNTASVSAGQSATYTITLTPANGFNSAVSLTCSGAPSNANCTFSPISVTPSGSSVTSTLTITTTAPSAIAAGAIRAQAGIAMPPTSGHSPWRYAFLGVGLVPLLLLRRKRHGWYTRWLTIGVVALFVGALSSCGSGGGGNGGGSGPSNPGTPSGSNTITVTGTSGALSHSTSVTLVVN